jgi:hypothetical protein
MDNIICAHKLLLQRHIMLSEISCSTFKVHPPLVIAKGKATPTTPRGRTGLKKSNVQFRCKGSLSRTGQGYRRDWNLAVYTVGKA